MTEAELNVVINFLPTVTKALCHDASEDVPNPSARSLADAADVLYAARHDPWTVSTIIKAGKRGFLDELEKLLDRKYSHEMEICRRVINRQLADQLELTYHHCKNFESWELVAPVGSRNKRNYSIPSWYGDVCQEVYSHAFCFWERDEPMEPAAIVGNSYKLTEEAVAAILEDTPLCIVPLNFPTLWNPGRTHQTLIVSRDQAERFRKLAAG